MSNEKCSQFYRGLLLSFILPFGGCAAIGSVSAVGQVTNLVLEATGIKKPATPELPDAQKPPRNIAIKLHAGENLNTDSTGRPLALVVRIYKLRQDNAFQQATYDTFLNPQKEKETLGADLLEAKEVTLIPGQRYEAMEKVTQEAYFIGVVALFRVPDPQRWKVAFPAKDADKSGIAIGLHACAISVGTGTTTEGNGGTNKFLSEVRCLKA